MRFFTKVLGLLWSWWASRAAGGRWKYCNTVKLRMVPGCSMAATTPGSLGWSFKYGLEVDFWQELWLVLFVSFCCRYIAALQQPYHPFDIPCLCVKRPRRLENIKCFFGNAGKKGEWDKIQTMGVLTKNWPIDPVGWSQPPVGWRSFHDLHTLVRWQVPSCGCNSWISPRAAWSSNTTDLVLQTCHTHNH